MTSIAWDGKTLAADGRCTSGSRIMQDNRAKILVDVHSEVRGSTVIAYALAGAADMTHRVGKWIEEGCPVTEDFKDCEFECIIITEDKAFTYSAEANDIFELQSSEALGSGYYYALSALKLRKNAVQAVKFAATIDIFSGGIGTYINCRTKKLVLKEFEV